MPTYLEIAVNVPQVADVFHYHLPPELEGQVEVGQMVIVPFGKKTVQGVVLRFVDEPAVSETRAVLDLVDAVPALTPLQLALAQSLSEMTLASIAACIGLMLPPGMGQQAVVVYTPAGVPGADAGRPLTDAQARLLALLHKRGPLTNTQIDRALPRSNWRASIRTLVRYELVTARPELPVPQVRPKIVRTARLACPPGEAEAALPNLGKAGSQALARRQAMVRCLMRELGPVDVPWIYAESGGSLADLRYLAELGLVTLGETEVWRDPLQGLDTQPIPPPPLTRDQQKVWEQLRAVMHTAMGGQPVAPVLLHGVTGSGKTEIYLCAVEEALRLGKQAIVLVPEIALTPQTVRRFMARFPGQVGLLHSGLSVGERYDTWRRARTGDLAVVVGPRSAVFTPFTSLGLIVMDECHDDSYYQSEPPFYHAREAAETFARLSGAVCLMGSATPDVTSTYYASQGRWQYLRLPARILAHRQAVQAELKRLESQGKRLQGVVSRYRPLEELAETVDLPPVQLVDMRLELQAGNRSIFSHALQNALGEVLEREQQAILFLNRRGMATYIFCRGCGYILTCPRCDLPLTFHDRQDALTCHHCGYQRQNPKTCPECKSPQIRHFGAGTERVEVEVQALFPQARILRWDFETTRKKGAHDAILSHFIAHRADVLIGTQMLAKGLDMPLVTLVGVVLADVGLGMPDYRAAERTFQILTQVAGRAGRSLLGGRVVLQTFQPEHYAIQAAAGHNYKAFYQRELEHRRQLGYPPFARLVRLEYRHTDPDQAERAAQGMAAQIRTWIVNDDRRATQVIGPVPCFFSRVAGAYHWQIVLRGPDPVSLLVGRQLGDWRVEVNPASLL
jgi:primosomal protein N' (replication factor Y) (superfamily II helicase)